MPRRFQDKHVIVTGGARSIGSKSQAVLCRGCLVTIFDCNRESLDDATRQLRPLGYRVHPFVVDVSVQRQVREAVDKRKRSRRRRARQ